MNMTPEDDLDYALIKFVGERLPPLADVTSIESSEDFGPLAQICAAHLHLILARFRLRVAEARRNRLLFGSRIAQSVPPRTEFDLAYAVRACATSIVDGALLPDDDAPEYQAHRKGLINAVIAKISLLPLAAIEKPRQ